jgi:hypothetical protein
MIFFKKSFYYNFYIICILTLLFISNIYSNHSVNRYFPFLNRSEEYVTKGSSPFTASVYFASASSAFDNGGGYLRIYELDGQYNLNDIIKSVQAVYQDKDIYNLSSAPLAWQNLDLLFQAHGKIKSQGVTLSYNKDLNWNGFSVGAWVPIMHVSTSSYFSFDKAHFQHKYGRDFDNVELVDKLRRTTHNNMNASYNAWSTTGLGDIDLFAKWHYFMDHQLLMKSIDLNLQAGVLVPTGNKSKVDYPTSVPFMNDGNWGFYFDSVTELELKQDVKFGFMWGGIYYLENRQQKRVPVGFEPARFSALKTDVYVKPGVTAKISPYITIENLTDGLHFQARYSYLRHETDRWKDTSMSSNVNSYLNKISSVGLTQEQIEKNIYNKRELTGWRNHYMTFELSYDSKEGLKKWPLKPIFFVTYDLPMGGRRAAKTHQLSIGAQLYF